MWPVERSYPLRHCEGGGRAPRRQKLTRWPALAITGGQGGRQRLTVGGSYHPSSLGERGGASGAGGWSHIMHVPAATGEKGG